MFTPEVIDSTDQYMKLKINDAIVLNIDYEKFENENKVDVDYDDKVITATEAEELTNTFLAECVETLIKKGEQ